MLLLLFYGLNDSLLSINLMYISIMELLCNTFFIILTELDKRSKQAVYFLFSVCGLNIVSVTKDVPVSMQVLLVDILNSLWDTVTISQNTVTSIFHKLLFSSVLTNEPRE